MRTALLPPLPREHGTWAMLYAPLLIGLASGRAGGANHPLHAVPVFLLVLAATSAFLAQAIARALPRPGAPARAARLAWAILYAAVAALAGLVLIARLGYRDLVPIAAIAGAALAVDSFRLSPAAGGPRTARAGREILAAAVFSLAAAAGAVIARGGLDRHGVALWLLSTLFFTSSVFTVRAWIDGGRIARRAAAGRTMAGGVDQGDGGPPRPGGRALVSYHLAMAAFLAGVLIGMGAASERAGVQGLWWTAAFAPPVARAFHARYASLRVHPALRTVGFMELGWTLLFTATMVASLR